MGLIDRLIEPAVRAPVQAISFADAMSGTWVGERLWISISPQEAEFVSLHFGLPVVQVIDWVGDFRHHA